MIYSFKNYGRDTAFTTIDMHYKEKRLEKWYLKNGVDPDRLKYLREELASVETSLEKAEGQRYS